MPPRIHPRMKNPSVGLLEGFKETPTLSSSKHVKLPHDYIHPRKNDVKLVNMHVIEDTYVPVPKITDGVLFEENLLGKLFQFHFVDHDLSDEETFPELVKKTTRIEGSIKTLIHQS